MILLLGDGEMTEESPDSHHNFSKDRLLQNKLLEADDKSVLDSLKDVYKSKPRVGSAKNESDLLCQEITGWIPKNINFRKTGKGKDGTKESKDSRPRGNLGDKYDNFVFNHYRDPKKYILQYREHHSYFDPLTTAAKKRLYGSNYVPPQQNENNSQTSPNERTRHNFQYTRRENLGKFKDKDNESSKSSSSNNDANAGTEQDTFRDRLLPVASTTRSSRTEKSEHSCISLSRVTVPTPLNLPQTSIGVKRKVSVSNGKQSPNHKPECQEQGQRTLDALATIVDEKQSPTTSANGESLSWREQLDALRQIKPKTKSKHRKARLFFFKEDGGFEVKGNCNGNPAGKCPDNIDPMDKEQVSQQRRIRHLVEQSKIKFASRFDDLSGSPDMIKGSRPLTDLSVGVSTDSSPKKADVKKTELKITNDMSEKQTSPSASNKTSPRTKVCPNPIWRFPQYQFSYTQITQFQRSRTCVPTDRRF